jgi:2-oxoisovalerate dehydrogenase E1 component
MTNTENNFSKSEITELYRALLLPRLIEEKMLNLLRQNKISKWFSGIGQEAISVGVAFFADKNDYILPMHRNLGVFTSRQVPFYPLFCQLFGKKDGFTRGRDRSFHFGLTEYKIAGMISHLAATMPVADGIALAKKLKGEQQVVYSFCGDGATSEGDFHEALNLAGVWKLPVIFVIENNGYALSTPTSEQYACESLVEKASGYGLHGMQIDGNDVFEVSDAVNEARKIALQDRPVFIEAMTFRIRGHEEASGTFYVPEQVLDAWKEKDPIQRMEAFMLSYGFDQLELEEMQSEIIKSFEPDLYKALHSSEPVYNETSELSDAGIYIPRTDSTDNNNNSESRQEIRFIDAIQLALKQAFTEDAAFIMMGQDIAEYGGVFKVTEGFVDQFGKERIRNTPIIESGIIGASAGLSFEGFKPVVELQFADFISCGFNQIINTLSKGRYRWMPPLNITIRAPHGAGVGAGPFHSQSPEGWFMSHPGLRILIPGTVEDAMNMLYTALYDPNPVLFFEHKKLYRSLKDSVPLKAKTTDLNRAVVRRYGRDLSIITYGAGLHWAEETAEFFLEKGVSIEIVDLRTLAPIDWQTIITSVKKTGKVLLLQEPSEIMGPMSEISAGITERGFQYLDAPVMRCSSSNTPVPFSRELEKRYLAESRLTTKVEELIRY